MRQLTLASLALILAGPAAAQSFVGSLDGTSISSDFESGLTLGQFDTDLAAIGWTEFSGNVRRFAGASNTAVISATGQWDTFVVTYDTGVGITANTQYELSFDVGFMTNVPGNTANFLFALGTFNDNNFVGVGDSFSGSLFYAESGTLNLGGGNGSRVSSLWTSGSTPLPGTLGVLFSLISYDIVGGSSDFFGFDNATLVASAIPEPSSFAITLGASAVALVFTRRRRRNSGVGL